MRPPRSSGSDPAADVWLGLIFASLLGEFVAAVYFPSLQAIGVDASAALLGLIAAPALLVWPPVRALAGNAPLLGVAGLLGSVVPLPVVRALLLGIGLAGVATGLTAAALVRPRELATRWIGGIVLAFWLRALGGSFDPLHAGAFPVLATALATAVAAARFRVGRPEPSAEDAGGHPRDGLPFGAAVFLVHGWFLGPTVVPRWASVDPTWQAAVGVALAAGFSVRAPWPAAAIGMALLALADGAAAMVGGLVLAVALPSAWTAAVARLARGGPRAVAVAVTVHLTLFGAQVVAFGADYALGWAVYRPALVVIAIAAAALAASPVRSWSLRPKPLLLAAAGLAGTVVLWCAGVVSSTTAGSGPVVAMTWNLQQAFDGSGRPNVGPVAAVVRREGATVIGLVESDATRPTSCGRDAVAWLAAKLGMHAVTGPDPRAATFGLAVLSAHPIRSSEVLLLRPSGSGLVALLLAVLDVDDGRPLRVAVTHLGGPARHRDAQARAVAEALAKVDGPLILLGDFNAAPGSGPMDEIARAGFALVDVGGNSTVFGGADCIDHILTKGLAAGPARVVDTGPVSDHLPVVATVRVP